MEKAIRVIKLSLLFSFLSYKGLAQSLSIKVDNQILNLQKNSVDTIISYSIGCLGGIPLQRDAGDTSCIVNGKIYLFWVKNGVYYKQEYDDCVNHSVRKATNSKFLKIALANLEAIKVDDIEGVEYYKDGKHHLVSVDHTCFTNFDFYIKKDHFKKRISSYELNTKRVEVDFSDNPKTAINISYKKNQKSILNKIKQLVEKETKYYPPFD